MKLDICAGDRVYEGYVGHDARPLEGIEIVCDARDLHKHVERGTVDAIMARHCLEHFSWRDTVDVLREWLLLLREGAPIQIEVPNGHWQVMARARGELTHAEFTNYAYGDQDYEGNAHYASFDATLLRDKMEAAGFVDVRVTDIGMVLVGVARRPS